MNVRKTTGIALILAFVFFTFASTGFCQKHTLRLGHIATTDHPTHLATLKFAELVNTRSQGGMKVQVYPNSQLGDERDVQEGMQLGTVEMAITGTAIVGKFQPEYNIIPLPYLFKDQAHVHRVMTGPIGKAMAAKLLEQKGIRVLDQKWDRAPRHLLTKKPVRTPDDLQGMKLRVPEQPVHIEAWRALGANPTGINFSEVFMALQQGIIDGLENPVDFLYTGGYYESAKNLTLTGHSLQVQALQVSEKFFQKLSPEYQKILTAAVIDAGEYQNHLIKTLENSFIDKMKAKGVQVISCNTELFARKINPDVINRLSKHWGGMELYNKIQESR